MKYVIDEEVCQKHNLSLADVFGILYFKASLDNKNQYRDMISRELIEFNEEYDQVIPTQRWDEEVSSILLESDSSVPNKDSCEALGERIRELFPKGIKTGSTAWRSNRRDITLRLQKFFKLYGDRWTSDEIYEATKRYVESFNGDYTYMRALKYFIMKSEKKEYGDGNVRIEDTSELATWLENGEDMTANNDDWMMEMR